MNFKIAEGDNVKKAECPPGAPLSDIVLAIYSLTD